jgi:hypothetical protein
MRTLQEKYNAINEGNFSKDQFLRDARMQQPNLVTQYNGYDDAVQILKNRGMIQEMVVDEISADTFKSAVDVAKGRGENQRASKLGSTFLNSFVGKLLMGGTISKIDIQKPSWGDYFDVTLEVLIPTQGTDGMYDKPKYLYYDVENDDWGMKGKGLEVTRQDARVLSQIAIKVNPDTKYKQGTQHFDIVGMNEARLNNKSLTDYRYKVTNDMDKYPYEQILRGLRVELEGLNVLGTPTPEEYKKALAKVLKNLEKDSIFYTNQVAGVNKKVDNHDQMIDVKKDNTVDKFNGMKKAALKEAIKGVIKSILSEGNEFGEGEEVYPMFSDEEEDDISHPRGYEDQDEIDYDDENFSDPFIDGDLDESKTADLHILAQESDTLRTFVQAVKAQYPDMDLNKAAQGLQFVWDNRNEGMDESVSLKDIL